MNSEFEVEFKPPNFDPIVLAAAQEYFDRCEEYDRTICTGPIMDGVIMPGNARELVEVNRNAYRIIDEIRDRGIDMAEFHRAKAYLNRL